VDTVDTCLPGPRSGTLGARVGPEGHP
jgi:hypothetical protein